MAIFLLTLISTWLLVEASQCKLNPSIYDFKFGSIRGQVISDGPGIFEDNPYLVPDKVVQKSYRATYRPFSPLIVQQNIAVLDIQDRRIIVDTGSVNVPEFRQFRNAGNLQRNLRAAGISSNSIDAVLLTHAHADHVSGLLTPNGTAAFPNAHVYISRADHKFWTADPIQNLGPILPQEVADILGEIYRRSIRPYKGRLRLVRENDVPFAGVKFIPTPGHSPGNSAIQITSKGETLIISGDNWGGQPNQVRNPEWKFFVETSPKDALKSRIQLMKRAIRQRALVLTYHEEFPGLGHIVRQRGKFDWIPVAFQSIGFGVQKKC